MLFMFVHCLFFVWFLKQYTAGRQQILRTGSVLAIIGSLSVALIYLKNLCHVFHLDVLPVFCMSHYFDAFVPLVSSLFHLAFFGMFKKVQSQEEYEFLDRPILSAIIGVMIFMVLHLVVLINFLKFQKFNWLEHMPRMIAVITVPFTAVAAILILYFYIKFYQFLVLQRNNGRP
jgi:hypothetical protein